jgi:excisionase family DNA binding protein
LAEPLRTAPEVAAYLGVPIDTLYAWRYRQKGPRGVRVGRHLRYRQEDVDRWLEQRTAGTPAA